FAGKSDYRRPHSGGAGEPVSDSGGATGSGGKPGGGRCAAGGAGVQHVSQIEQFVRESVVAGRVATRSRRERDEQVERAAGRDSTERFLWRVGLFCACAASGTGSDGGD